MTPHCFWLWDYTPLCVLIRLADNTVIYSKGVGNVVFNPVISGRVARPVEFTWVLHVPKLQHNLLAVLYLSRHLGINIHISSTECTMVFSINGEQLFVGQINKTIQLSSLGLRQHSLNEPTVWYQHYQQIAHCGTVVLDTLGMMLWIR